MLFTITFIWLGKVFLESHLFYDQQSHFCLLSTSLCTASHNRPLVPAGEQVQRVKELKAPAAPGAVGMGVVYTSVHLSFPPLFFSFIAGN